MRFLKRLQSRTAAFTHDVLAIPVAWLLAYWLRFNLEAIPPPFSTAALTLLPALIAAQAGAYWLFGLYRGVWRFASIPDLVRIAKAVAVGTAIGATVIFVLTRMQNVPRSVVPLYALLLFCLLAGDRFLYRWFKDSRLGYYGDRRVLIAGCGEAGELLARDLLRQRPRQYQPVAFADDNPTKVGREIHGIRVAGRVDQIPELVRRLKVELILIAIPSLTSAEMRRVVGYCEAAGVSFRTLPRLDDLISGQVTVTALRDVAIEDLLGREPVTLDRERMRGRIEHQRVLVTGAGGSIGTELCRQIAKLNPGRLAIVDHSEFNLHAIGEELKETWPALVTRSYLASTAQRDAIEQVFAAERSQIVFHAAAYKHVPMLENQLTAAVRNNVLGTFNAAQAAHRHGCEAFVLISTDKAVYPANVMGATKRVAELVCQSLNHQSDTAFVTVRFGNVLNSAGSVVPIFRRQIARGGPLTVTHPDVSRYFMTIPEAAQLIVEAAALGQGGEIFILDMGEPVKIQYLAEQMIRLAGHRPHADIRIVHTGLRPGEKMAEELLYKDETLIATDNKKILLARGGNTDAGLVQRTVAELEALARQPDTQALIQVLERLVPGFARAAGERKLAEVVMMDEIRR
jgi:FlaA1/EpsC-like NDP-sugar epimerase